MQDSERRFSAYVKVGSGDDVDVIARGVYLLIDDYGESAEREAIDATSKFISTLFSMKRELSQCEAKLGAEHLGSEVFL